MRFLTRHGARSQKPASHHPAGDGCVIQKLVERQSLKTKHLTGSFCRGARSNSALASGGHAGYARICCIAFSLALAICAPAFAGPTTFSVLSNDGGAWPEILGTVGFRSAPA